MDDFEQMRLATDGSRGQSNARSADNSLRSQVTKGLSDKEMISRYQGKFLSHRIDLNVDPTEGFDLSTARKLADFSNLCYYDAHQVAMRKKQRIEAMTGQPLRSVKIMKTLGDILSEDNDLQWCTYTTHLSPEQTASETLRLVGEGKAASDTQWLYALSPKVMVIAFRGTEGTKMKDILSDLNARKVIDPCLYSRAKRTHPPKSGKERTVHAGFKHALDDVWDDVLAAVQTHAWAAGRALYLTGHSLGGALATLCAGRLEIGRYYNEWREAKLLEKEGEMAAVKGDVQPAVMDDDELVYRPAIAGLYTYGSPRVFGTRAARKFDTFTKPRHFRFVNNNDIIPRIPLAAMGFRHTGHHMYVTCDMVIERNPSDAVVFADGLRGRVKNGLMKWDLLLDSMSDHSITEYCAALNKNLADMAQGGPKKLEEDFNEDLMRYMPKFKSMRNFRDENYFNMIEHAHDQVRQAARVVVSQLEARGPSRLEALLAPDDDPRNCESSRCKKPVAQATTTTSDGNEAVVEGSPDLVASTIAQESAGPGVESQSPTKRSGAAPLARLSESASQQPPAFDAEALQATRDALRRLPNNISCLPYTSTIAASTNLDSGAVAGAAEEEMTRGQQDFLNNLATRKWAIDLAKAVHALLTPNEEVQVIVESERMDVSNAALTDVHALNGLESMPGVIFVATNTRVILLRVRPASWASIKELNSEHRPQGSVLAHQVDFTVDKGLFYSSIPYHAFTGVQMSSSLKVAARTVVSAQLSFWAIAVATFLALYLLGGVSFKAFHPEKDGGAVDAILSASLTLVGYWKVALLLMAVLYVVFYSAPRFCYRLSTDRAITSTVEAFTVTIGYRDPVMQTHCIGTIHLSPETDPSVILHFVRGIENTIRTDREVHNRR